MRKYTNLLAAVRREISKVVVGQDEVINALLNALLCNAHVLVEGVPGIAKTLLIRALASATGCNFSRIQFTVDLLPTDITGITAYNEKKGFYVVKGPIFTNFVIADEINRAPPKTQSALLEAMQERQVTIGKQTFKLQSPFFVMANNNPIESSGTYPLPEAQIDRFLFKVVMKYPSDKESKQIIEQNISLKDFKDYKIKAVLKPRHIVELQDATKRIKHTDKIKDYIVKITSSTRNPDKYHIRYGKYIEYGASPRACIGLFIAAKADALIKGKDHITPQNVKNVAYNVLRHRILLNYIGQAEKIKTDDIIKEILSKVPIP
jgi:MoxR-like ATPase